MKKLGAALLPVPVLLGLTGCLPMDKPAVPANLTKTIQFELTVDIAADEPDEDGVSYGTSASIRIEAIPNDPRAFGGRSNGGSYPYSGREMLPFEHTIYYEPPLLVTAQLTATNVGLYEGESVTCVVRVNGDEVDRKVYSSVMGGPWEEGLNPESASITCGTGGPV